MVERSGEINGVSFYEASSLKRGRGVEVRKANIESRIQSNRDECERLDRVLLEVSVKSEMYTKLVEEAQADLYRLYTDAGIDGESITFPRVFFVPEANKSDIKPFGQDWKAFYDVIADICIVYVSESDNAATLGWLIHHELNHSLGRRAFVMKDDGIMVQEVSGQVGHQTMRPNLLEEGVMDYFASKFVHGSNSKLISRIAKKNRPTRTSDDYATCVEVVEQLVLRARDLWGMRGAEQMENLLLASRVDVRAKNRFVRWINELYGDNVVASYLFRFGPTKNEARGILDVMEKIVSG